MAVRSHKRLYLNKEGNVIHTEEMEQNMTSVKAPCPIEVLGLFLTVSSGT